MKEEDILLTNLEENEEDVGVSSSSSSSSNEENIEAKKGGKIYKSRIAPEKDLRRKENRERTPAQIAAWNRALEARTLKRKERMEAATESKNEIKKETKQKLEEKIIKKAISIKKRQIKAEKVLDEISDDDTPIEEIKQKIRKFKTMPLLPKTPLFTFL